MLMLTFMLRLFLVRKEHRKKQTVCSPYIFIYSFVCLFITFSLLLLIMLLLSSLAYMVAWQCSRGYAYACFVSVTMVL